MERNGAAGRSHETRSLEESRGPLFRPRSPFVRELALNRAPICAQIVFHCERCKERLYVESYAEVVIPRVTLSQPVVFVYSPYTRAALIPIYSPFGNVAGNLIRLTFAGPYPRYEESIDVLHVFVSFKPPKHDSPILRHLLYILCFIVLALFCSSTLL